MYRGKYNNLIKELVKESKNDLNNNLNDNFWKWFGNSKIVDENGNPLICYHGTNNKFNSFNKSINGHFGAGIYFTPNYSVGKSYGSKLKSVYLKMENPLWFNRDMPEELEKAVYFRNKELLKDYDGIIVGFPENGMDFVSEIIVFEPNQIKSIDNNGDWNPNSNNIYESFVKDYSENPILYYTSSESEAKQMISTLLTKNPVRGIYDLKHKIYIFGDAYNVIHADLIEKMKLYGKEHLSYPIVDKEIYEYLDKNCAMFKVIDETDYKSFSRSDGYKYAFIGKLDDNQYVIFRNNELAPSYYNAPDELKKMQQVPLFKNIQFKKYDIRGVGLNTKDQLPQRMVDNSSNIMEDYDYIDDIEVLLNPTKKEFNDLVKRNKWYRILLSNTGIAIWSADTPLLHHQVEEEYDVRNTKHLFAYNGNVYFQDYNFKKNDGYTDDDKKWFIEQAKKLDNNSILKTYFPKIHMEQDTIDMFNNKIVIEYFLLKKNVLTENKLTEIQEDIKYIMSSDVILFSCDPASYEFMLKCFKQGQKTEYFYFNFYKNKPKFINLCRHLLSRFNDTKVTGTDESIKQKISNYDGQSISKEGVQAILNGYYGNNIKGIFL
uniref:PolyVal ADP-Ribosyltransferase n=1 Tax=Myoviridae sp. ctWb16 TaxID=2827690 RepID=A0A8S5T0Z5_9CAUD|nr:MAG TPA: PolyVal ADP-Ribosyltransferase [Myoviridae sp. ctWb16]